MTERQPKSSKTVFVALLRGVNVGGNNIIKMSSLKTSFEQLGFTGVTTYINSGNILFTSKERDARKLERRIEKMLGTEYALDCKVVVRSFAEMATLIKSLPKNWDGGDTQWKANVIFLRHAIDTEQVLDRLTPKPNIEKVSYYPGTLLWSARVSDISRTAMVKLSSQKIFQDMTVRNTNTTRKLYELMKKMVEEKSS